MQLSVLTQEQLHRKPVPDRSGSKTLMVSLPEKVVGSIWTVIKDDEAGPGLIHGVRNPVHVEFHIQDNALANQVEAFCSPVLAH